MTRSTRGEWAERVRRWRASGETARAFAEREGLKSATLRWWSSELGRAKFVDATSLLVSMEPSLELEVGATRIRVTRGFDAELLRAVVAALETR